MAAAISAAVLPNAYAQTAQIDVEQPWTRSVGSRAQTAVGYLTIHNQGNSEDRLVSASSPFARAVEMHRSVRDANGVMRMEPIPGGIPIPAGGTLRLAPANGRHLMLIGPTRPFERGERIPLVLNFEKAGTVEVALVVEAAGARAASAQGHHGAH